MGGRVKGVLAATLLLLAGSVVSLAPRVDAGGFEELVRPPGLDPDWPDCFRSAPFGIDTIGCAVNDVPGEP